MRPFYNQATNVARRSVSSQAPTSQGFFQKFSKPFWRTEREDSRIQRSSSLGERAGSSASNSDPKLYSPEALTDPAVPQKDAFRAFMFLRLVKEKAEERSGRKTEIILDPEVERVAFTGIGIMDLLYCADESRNYQIVRNVEPSKVSTEQVTTGEESKSTASQAQIGRTALNQNDFSNLNNVLSSGEKMYQGARAVGNAAATSSPQGHDLAQQVASDTSVEDLSGDGL